MRCRCSLGLALWCSFSALPQAPAQQPSSADIIPGVQEFEKDSGYPKPKNFRSVSPTQEAHFLCYSTGVLQLPDSYDGLRLSRGTEAGCGIDESKRDVFFYRAEALEHDAKITSSLSAATDERKAVVVAHEDFHAAMDAFPAPINEAATTLVGFVTAAEYAKAQFGDASDLHRNLSKEPELFLRKAELIKEYHARLRKLYASVHHGASPATVLAQKRIIFEELGTRCRKILPEPHSFNRCPSVLNNAGLAFDMTYADYYPAIYKMYVAHNRDLKATIEAVKKLKPNVRPND